MRYPASEKLEIIRLVEQSHLPVRRTLEKIGILPAAFYRWYNRYQTGGPEALEDRPSKPKQSGTASLMPSEAVSCSWRWNALMATSASPPGRFSTITGWPQR